MDSKTGPTVEQMIQDLIAAGWTAKTRNIWRDPKGKLFLGPAGAWTVMLREHKDTVDA